MEGNSSDWQEDIWAPTAEPGIMVTAIEEDVPTLTVATIVGVTLVVLVTIVAVFVLGVLIDCRQQRMLQKKMGEAAAKRPKNKRRVSAHPEGDVASIVNNMEEPELSLPPADVLREIRAIP